jgi:hypothetical protein
MTDGGGSSGHLQAVVDREEEFVCLKPATHVWHPQGTVLISGDSNSWIDARV